MSAETSTWMRRGETARICESRDSYNCFDAGAIVDAAGLAAALVLFAISCH